MPLTPPVTNLPIYEYNYTAPNAFYFGNTFWLAQTFTVGTNGPPLAHSMAHVFVWLRRNDGTTPGTCTIHLRNVDGTGAPTGADLATGSGNADTVDTAGGSWLFIPISAYTIYSGVQYALILDNAPTDPSVLQWYYSSLNPYTGGNLWKSYDSGATWDNTDITNYDMGFAECGTSFAWIALP